MPSIGVSWSKWFLRRLLFRVRRRRRVLERRPPIVLVLVVVLDFRACGAARAFLVAATVGRGTDGTYVLRTSGDDQCLTTNMLATIEDEDDWRSPRSARWRFLLSERINQERNSN